MLLLMKERWDDLMYISTALSSTLNTQTTKLVSEEAPGALVSVPWHVIVSIKLKINYKLYFTK